MAQNNSNYIKSFRDLEVYQSTYKASIVVAKEILPFLPSNEKYDLRDQLSRSTTPLNDTSSDNPNQTQQTNG